MRPRSFLLHMLFAAVLATAAWLLWPAESALWRRLVAVVLAFGLGFQVAAAMESASRGRVAGLRSWLECLAFPLVMGAVYYLPSEQGWAFLLGGWSWRFLVRNLWK